MNRYNIRTAHLDDVVGLYRVAEDMGMTHEERYFERCLSEQAEGRRDVLVAEEQGGALLAGYAQIVWSPVYRMFRALHIPEIQDVNVIPRARRGGLGAALVEACERAAQTRGCTEVGIAVGLDSSFGAAQRLYIKRGYVPDGNGVCYDEEPVAAGSLRPVDRWLTLKLVKTL